MFSHFQVVRHCRLSSLVTAAPSFPSVSLSRLCHPYCCSYSKAAVSTKGVTRFQLKYQSVFLCDESVGLRSWRSPARGRESFGNHSSVCIVHRSSHGDGPIDASPRYVFHCIVKRRQCSVSCEVRIDVEFADCADAASALLASLT